jgi:hypothetical protein
MRQATTIAVLVFVALLGCSQILAQQEAVVIPRQKAKELAGVVLAPNGDPIDNVLVEECSPDWATVLRSTRTDSRGRFRFSADKRQKSHHLRFNRSGFNWVELEVRLDKHGPMIMVKMPFGT